MHSSSIFASSLAAVIATACSSPIVAPDKHATSTDVAAASLVLDTTLGPVTATSAASMGKVPVLMIHVIGDHDAAWTVTRARFQHTLELLYAHDYLPITVAQMVDRRIDVPAGKRPVVFTFDDASPSQFRYIERNGKLEVDPASAVGMWVAFAARHPDWKARATFCLLSGAEAGRSFFGNKDIEGQHTEWRFQKVRYLESQGFELCNHTLWHANLSKYPDAFVEEQIARGQLAIDSAVPGYKVRTFALPLGIWPKNRALAQRGEWRDPKSGTVTRYNYDAILTVGGGPSVSPFDPAFDRHAIRRYTVVVDALDSLVARLERTHTGYVVPASR